MGTEGPKGKAVSTVCTAIFGEVSCDCGEIIIKQLRDIVGIKICHVARNTLCLV